MEEVYTIRFTFFDTNKQTSQIFLKASPSAGGLGSCGRF